MSNFLEIFDEFPNFYFEDYKMRALEINDAEDYFCFMNHPEVLKFINFSNRIDSVEKAEEEISYWRNLFYRKKGIYWGIDYNNELIGTVGYNDLMLENMAEISYDLNFEYWNKGIMTMALEKLIEFSRVKLQLKILRATVVTFNKKSIKLLEKLGFNSEKLLKDFETSDGISTVDSYLYIKYLDKLL